MTMTRSTRIAVDAVAVMAMSLSFAACASTRMTVAKVSPPCDQGQAAAAAKTPAAGMPTVRCGGAEPGIRYALPQPFLLVKPSPSGDGSFSVEVIYLPDERRTYAIDASTKRGKFTLDVDVKDGLLSKLAWKRSDSDIVAENVRAAGEMAKTRLTAIQEQEKEDKKQRDDDRKKAQDKVEALVTEADKASFDVTIRQAEVDEILAFHAKKISENKPVTDEDLAKLRAANLELAKAKLRATEAERLLGEGRRKAVSLGALANAPAVEGAPAKEEKMPEELFKSPVLYAIREDKKGGFRLEVARWGPNAGDPSQIDLKTRTAPDLTPAPAAPKATGNPPAITPNNPNQEFSVDLTAAIKDIVGAQRAMSGPSGSINPPPFTVQRDGDKKLKIRVTSGLPAGEYSLTVPVVFGQKQVTNVSFTLVVK